MNGSTWQAGPQPTRVLHVVRNLNVGGLEVGVVNLVRRLRELPFEQGICCLEERGALAEELADQIPVWECGGQGRKPWHRLPLQAAQLMRAFRPHVVHARNCGAWVDAAAAWLLAGRPGRLVFTLHGWDRVDPLPRRRAFLYRQLARLTDSLAAVSRETAEQFARETGIAAARFAVLHTGVDTTKFRPREGERAPRPGPVVLGCVARLDALKGHEDLIAAVAELVRQKGLDLELRLLGDGPHGEALQQLARQVGLGQRVRFHGAVNDVPERLRELDVFVLASQREGRPTSIMEAVASGLPVVATAVGSVSSLVEDGRTGFLVEPKNVAALALAIAALVCDAALRERFGQAARDKAVREMSLTAMVENYAAFYRRERGMRSLGLCGLASKEADEGSFGRGIESQACGR